MAVTDAYADAATYRAVIDKTDVAEDAEVLTDLTAISRFIDRRMDRHFTKDAADVARDFRVVSNGPRLYVDDMSEAPASVVVDENGDGTPEVAYTISTQYEAHPLNADKGSEPRPYTSLFIPSWSTRAAWREGVLVRVTCQWGWPAVPDAVKRACIHLTAILRLETQRAQATITELGGFVQASPQARGIIEDLLREYSRRPLLV